MHIAATDAPPETGTAHTLVGIAALFVEQCRVRELVGGVWDWAAPRPECDQGIDPNDPEPQLELQGRVVSLLESSGDVEVVGKANDGEEGLQLALSLKPDVICLDLEMPRMDGFTFLRILMSRHPTPVVVVSSYSQKENVFKALELGALDFVAKPTGDEDLAPLKDEILAKVGVHKLSVRAILKVLKETRPELVAKFAEFI